MTTQQSDSVRRAAGLLGNQRALAVALGVTPVTVNQWLRPKPGSGRPVPPKQCVRIERLTKGEVTRRELRPDDWQDIWPELVNSEQKQPPELTHQSQAATKDVAQEARHA